MYQTGDTIRDILGQVENHELVLPAIQREFVWDGEQVCRLFDSIMQGYPFNTFLYWQVNPENSHKFQFYDFVLNYHQRDNPHCPPLSPIPGRALTAVLDGQQRLTALNIGFRGSMAWKQPKLWRTNPNAFPIRKLHLDLLWQSGDVDSDVGLKYRFAFLTDGQARAVSNTQCWFPVRDILSMKDSGPSMVKWLNERLHQDQVDGAYNALFRLFQVVHSEKLVAYYEEKSQNIEEVLQIFIRTNSGGTPLSYSDLLLSIAVAQWQHTDARQEIHSLVDELNQIGGGFSFSKDLVLKAGLMLSDIGSVGFNVDNFNRENMSVFEENWESIKRALTLTVQLVSSFGFSGQNLRAVNSILPIAYYLHANGYSESYLARAEYTDDRRAIREWLIRSLLKSGVWGSGLDTLLTALRRVVRDNGQGSFPVVPIREEMARRGKPLVFQDEEVEELADMQYRDPLAFALLSLIFPFVDLRDRFHIDHIFPYALFTKRRLDEAGVPGEDTDKFIRRRNGLANLQLLEGNANLEKSAKMPSEWLSERHPDPASRRQYEENHMLGHVPTTITEFDVFYDERRERLKAKIEALLGRARVASDSAD